MCTVKSVCPDLLDSVYARTYAPNHLYAIAPYLYTRIYILIYIELYTRISCLRARHIHAVSSVSTADHTGSTEREREIRSFMSLRRPSSPVPGTATDPSIRKFAVLSRGGICSVPVVRAIREGSAGIEHLVVA